MTKTQLEYIVAVDNCNSFIRASEKMFVTQPTLSMQIKKLEEELGATLFDRSKAPVATTEIGQKIITQARNVISENNRIYDIISEESGQITGKFRLAVIPTIAPFLLPLFLESFVKNNKGLKLTIDELQTEEIISGLKKDEIDAGIVATPLSNKEITESPIYYEPFYAYISPKHPLFRKEKISSKELNVDDIWLLKEGHCFRDQVINICSQNKKENPAKKSLLNFEGATLETLIRMVESNFGMTFIPYLLGKELSSTSKGRFIREFKNPTPKREISIIFQRSFLKRKIIYKLHEEIVKHLPSELINKKSGYIVDLY